MDSSALKYLIPKVNVNANNEVINIVPDYTVPYWSSQYGVFRIDPTHTSVFVADLSSAVSIYTDDVNNRVDVQGRIRNIYDKHFYYFAFAIDPTIAVNYPGLEFTVYFKNIPTSSGYIGVYPDATLESFSGFDYLSPGNTFNFFDTASLTLRSDGLKFRVISSGPVSWSTAYDYD